MADTDQSLYTLRYNQVTQNLEGAGGTPQWNPCLLGSANLVPTAVTPGSYTSADITVDAQGRITAASDGSGGGGSPAGSDQDVQFNQTGAFAGSGNLKYDYSDIILLIGGISLDGGQNVVTLTPIDSTTRDALTGINQGAIIYNSTSNALNYYDGTNWQEVAKV